MPANARRASTARSGFWDWMARRYARTAISDEAAYNEKLRMTQEHLTPEAKVLEIACGTGSTALIHAPFAAEILATDFSANMIEIANEKASAQGITNVTFQQAGIDDLEIAPGSQDMVMAHSILHLLEAPDVAVAKAYSWLKPGGVLVTSTICLGEAGPLLRVLAPVFRALPFLPFIKTLSERDLTAWMTGAGLEIETLWRPKPKAATFIIARKPSGA